MKFFMDIIFIIKQKQIYCNNLPVIFYAGCSLFPQASKTPSPSQVIKRWTVMNIDIPKITI